MSVAGCRLPVRNAGAYLGGAPARKELAREFDEGPCVGFAQIRRLLSRILGTDEFICPETETDTQAEFNHMEFERLDFFRFSTPCEIGFTVDRRRHLVCFCEAGHVNYVEDGMAIPLDERRAAILASPVRGRFTCAAGSTLVGVVISEADFRREASSVLKGVASARLGGTRGFDISANPGRVFRDAVHMLLADLDTAQAARNNKSIRLMFGRLIVYALLQFSGNETMDGGKNNLVPRHIKRAEEYIKAHLADRLDNLFLAEVSQVSPRSLYRGFVQFRGVTPARYIQELRLDEAHRLLTTMGSGSDIRDIAEKTGFGSYAAFWRAYVRKFGAPPSKSRPPRPREDYSNS